MLRRPLDGFELSLVAEQSLMTGMRRFSLPSRIDPRASAT